MAQKPMQCTRRRCPDPGVLDLEQALLVERHHAEWFLAERMVPGAEVHRDGDVTWVVHSGQAWRNAGIMVRVSASSAERRLDTLLARYEAHGRGMALWISPAATPANLPALLRARRLRCQKHFPAMLRKLADPIAEGIVPEELEIRRVVDVAEYEKTPHPAIGPITTPLRRQALERLRALASDRSGRARGFVASLKGKPIGAIELFLGSESAGIHGLSVIEGYEGRGIGSALIEHVCRDAVRSHAKTMVLLPRPRDSVCTNGVDSGRSAASAIGIGAFNATVDQTRGSTMPSQGSRFTPWDTLANAPLPALSISGGPNPVVKSNSRSK